MTAKKHTLISDAEEARIQKMIASDPDAPEVTPEQATKAKPFAEAFPALAETMRKNVGGRPRSASPKVPVSIRLDQDVIAKFKATGPGWQTRINEVLRKSA
ncbi:BrnA antitoxin family protein, partial [Sulfitobacter sp. F26169L]|uniref:BrnA antitoxin family protein n=1 Tax=Sulfitobacter sp. F26169L TaxID=2996015 RepID=UPI002260C567